MSAPSPSASSHEPAEPRNAVATAELAVVGMHCGSCVALIEEALSERSGVISAAVDLESARATVGYDPSQVDVDDLRSTIEAAGYSATPVG